MSLDARIIRIAQEEVTRALARVGVSRGVPSGEQLQQQITDLHEHIRIAAQRLHRLEERLEDLEAEKPAAQTEAPQRRPKRRGDS